MKTLSSEHIQQLFQFCEKHSVRYYDVQVELVDHLAFSIEQQQEQNPEMSFEDAFLNARKKLSNCFDELVIERAKQIVKQGKKAQLKFFASFFRWPKMVMTFFFHRHFLSIGLFFPIYCQVCSANDTCSIHVIDNYLSRYILWKSG